MRNIFYEHAVLVGSLEKAGRKTNPGRRTTWRKVGTGNQIDVSMLDEVRHTDPKATWPRLYGSEYDFFVLRRTSDSERPKKMHRVGIQVDFGALKAANVEGST